MNLFYKIVIFILRLTRLANILPDKLYLKLLYRRVMGKKLNLENPQTFNEKLNWLKLYDRKPEYSKMVDKYEAKKYVASIIGDEYIIPTYGVWDKFDDIDFNQIPNQFVLKCTHDSGSVVICKDKSKFDLKNTKQKIGKALKSNLFYIGREWPYKNVTPRIMVEKLILDIEEIPNDYKILCFNGIPKLIEVHTDRFKNHTQDFYDLQWNKLVISQQNTRSKIIHARPKLLNKMIELSEKLAFNTYHVRIDWYTNNDWLFFGEITFFDGSGLSAFDEYEHDLYLGSLIDLTLK